MKPRTKTKIGIGAGLLVALFLCVEVSNARAAPIAGMAVRVVGSPQVVTGRKTAPLRRLQRLEEGQRVQCGANDEAVIVLYGSGARFRVRGGTSATVGMAALTGASKMGGLRAPSARVAKTLGGARMGALTARPGVQGHQRMAASIEELKTARGWMTEGERRFQWQPISGSDSYSFTLFDADDNVVMARHSIAPQLDYPTDVPALRLREPYVWRVIGFRKSGKPTPDVIWGVVTWLSRADSARLQEAVGALKAEIVLDEKDATSWALLADTYAEYGALEMALATLDEMVEIFPDDGYGEALIDTTKRLNFIGRALSEASKQPAN